MGCKLLEIMADGMYAVFHRFEAFLKKRLTHKQRLLDFLPTAVVLLQSVLFLLQPLKQAPAGLPAPSSLRPDQLVEWSGPFHRALRACTPAGRQVWGSPFPERRHCQVSRFVRPVGLQIFQDEESFIRLAKKMAYQ